MANKQTLEFWFDFLSPYAWVAWAQAGDFCDKHDLVLKPRPVVFAGLLDHWGQLGPAEIAPKRLFVFKDAMRKAHREGLAMTYPETHPFNPVTMMRVVSGSLPQR